MSCCEQTPACNHKKRILALNDKKYRTIREKVAYKLLNNYFELDKEGRPLAFEEEDVTRVDFLGVRVHHGQCMEHCFRVVVQTNVKIPKFEDNSWDAWIEKPHDLSLSQSNLCKPMRIIHNTIDGEYIASLNFKPTISKMIPEVPMELIKEMWSEYSKAPQYDYKDKSRLLWF